MDPLELSGIEKFYEFISQSSVTVHCEMIDMVLQKWMLLYDSSQADPLLGLTWGHPTSV